MSTNIIIVGNGTSLLDKEYGTLIDSFDCVVRFNSFKIKGYEKHTGTQTNIWFTCAANSTHINSINDFDRVFVHTWHWGEDDRIFQKIAKGANIPVVKTKRDIVHEIPIKSPSTGLIAIHYLLKEYKSITLTGFDWWDRKDHHYGDREARGTLHKPKEEYKFIKKLEQDNRVVFLKEK